MVLVPAGVACILPGLYCCFVWIGRGGGSFRRTQMYGCSASNIHSTLLWKTSAEVGLERVGSQKSTVVGHAISRLVGECSHCTVFQDVSVSRLEGRRRKGHPTSNFVLREVS